MIVHYQNMTGDELKRIYKISGLKSEDFARKLGLEKHQLYTQFARQSKPIDMEISEALKDVPEFAQHRTLVVREQINSPSPNEGSEVVKVLTETIQVMKEVLLKGEKMSNALLDDNRHIKEEALLYRRMLTDGYEAGLLQWKTKKAS